MSILSLQKVSLAFGHLPILHEVNLELQKGERICLVGRNGTGKSTLFKVIGETISIDDGNVWKSETLKLAYLEQDVPSSSDQTVFEIVAAGLGKLGNLLSQFHTLSQQNMENNEGLLHEFAEVQHEIEVLDGWNLSQKVESIISRLSLPADKKIGDCSGGLRRKTLLAQALVSEPDLLLLDEPTNHMDIEAINWLEEFLLRFKGTIIFITHDRTFVRLLSTRFIELDRGNLASFNGDFAYYQEKKAEMLNAEVKTNARFDKKLAEQEIWIRQGIKARRTRNEGRVRDLEAMREQRAARISTISKVKLNIDSAEASGKLVADLSHVNFNYEQHCIIKDFSTRILRGDRIGIIGPNGSGKTTLLNIILGQLKPQDGKVDLGTKLDIAYFDQQRNQLDLEKTVKDNISDGNDYVDVKGKSKHVIGYLRDFLFPPEKIDTPVSVLSGGEKNRLLLARLFTKKCNLLVLDEPTNDLDVDTLELLEDLLSDFEGTLLLVSHDRTFLDNIVTSTIVFEGDGHVDEYVGGYQDYLRQKSNRNSQGKSKTEKPNNTGSTQENKSKAKPKLSYKENQELQNLPAKIEKFESIISKIEQEISEATFYQQDKDTIAKTLAELESQRETLKKTYERWEYLDS